jgi:hypothetical protein
MPVIGFLNSATAGATRPLLGGFRQGLRQTGYVEGQNVHIAFRWAEGRYDRLPDLAAELVALPVAVIAAFAPAALAARCLKGRPCAAPYHFQPSGRLRRFFLKPKGIQKMSRGSCTFRQRDMTRAVKAMVAAGANLAHIRVEISKAGSITVTASEDRGEDREGNEWDRI